MKKAKKIITPILMTGALVGCSNNSAALKSLNIKRVTDYLYEATLNYDFDYKIAQKYYTKFKPKLGGCSAISIGNMRGRNYDWEYSFGTEFVVSVPATKNRHKSIGISALVDLSNAAAMDGTYHAEQYDMLPFLTLDGINDAGIYVNVNVVPFQSLGKWEMKNDDPEDDLCELCGPRLVLDNCACLEDVIKEYDKYDWFSLGNDEETHLMVTGPRTKTDKTVSTVVFEFVPFTEGGKTYRKLCVISNNDADKAIVNNDETRFYKTNAKNIVMTNFNLWHFDTSLTREEYLSEREGSVIDQPMGLERYEILKYVGGDRDSVTAQEMQDIMKKVYYSNAYDLYQPDFWYSEYKMDKATIKKISEDERYPYGDINKLYQGDANAIALIKKQQEAWSKRDRDLGPDQGLWETIHTSIFNYDQASFRVIPREGAVAYEYKLNK